MNNLPQINVPFILRPGLTLEEVYAKAAEIEQIEKARGMFAAKEKDEDFTPGSEEERLHKEAIQASLVAKMDAMAKQQKQGETAVDMVRLF